MTEEDMTCPNRKPGSRRCNCGDCRRRRAADARKRAEAAFVESLSHRTVMSREQALRILATPGVRAALDAACVAYTGGAQKKS